MVCAALCRFRGSEMDAELGTRDIMQCRCALTSFENLVRGKPTQVRIMDVPSVPSPVADRPHCCVSTLYRTMPTQSGLHMCWLRVVTTVSSVYVPQCQLTCYVKSQSSQYIMVASFCDRVLTDLGRQQSGYDLVL